MPTPTNSNAGDNKHEVARHAEEMLKIQARLRADGGPTNSHPGGGPTPLAAIPAHSASDKPQINMTLSGGVPTPQHIDLALVRKNLLEILAELDPKMRDQKLQTLRSFSNRIQT